MIQNLNSLHLVGLPIQDLISLHFVVVAATVVLSPLCSLQRLPDNMIPMPKLLVLESVNGLGNFRFNLDQWKISSAYIHC